jgi:hypothetical protein
MCMSSRTLLNLDLNRAYIVGRCLLKHPSKSAQALGQEI